MNREDEFRAGPPPGLDAFPNPDRDIELAEDEATAVLAGGCFWCTEAVFRQLAGVLEVTPGYAGGAAETADYRSVSSGATGHAEAIRIRYDPQTITYGELLKVFFSVAHDPTQLNRQDNDRGRQYRSAVFHADEAERRVAESYIEKLDAAGVYENPIVTTLEPLEAFYEAEPVHEKYTERNPDAPYVRLVALPKVEKVRHQFSDRLKSSDESEPTESRTEQEIR